MRECGSSQEPTNLIFLVSPSISSLPLSIATLPQNEKQIHMVRLRLSEVERNKVDIRWEEVSSTEPSGYPRYIKAALTTDLPRILQMTSRRVDEFTKKRDFASTLSLMFGLLKGARARRFDFL